MTKPTSARSPSATWWQLVRLLGFAMLVVTGAIHLDLYLTGYRSLPTIGPLFLLQVISSFLIATAVAVFSLRLVAIAGAGFLLPTLIGYLVSLKYGLFGFREVRTAAGTVAGIIEVIGFAALVAFALRPVRYSVAPVESTVEHHTILHRRHVLLTLQCVAGVLTLQAAVSLGLLVANSDTSSSHGGASAILKTTTIRGTSVLTNEHGFTLYWFAPDSATTSRCYGTCALYWPPLLGTPSAASIPGSFTTLERSNGSTQVTYENHPLYTYVGDSSPGQSRGNHIFLNGGWWYEMKVTK